jgi:dipeptidyl aminopeptidase/acylaminoacyl peptidase
MERIAVDTTQVHTGLAPINLKKLTGLLIAAAMSAVARVGAQPNVTSDTTSVGRSPATIDDLLNKVSEPEQITISPDSAWVAVTIERPATAGERYRDLSSIDRTDVWLFSTDGKVRRNLTQGHADASGWLEPLWSPDGRRLAMLSTRGTDGNIRLYVWDRRRDRIELATTRGVHFRLAMYNPTYQRLAYCSWLHANFSHYRWLNDTALAFLAVPAGNPAEWHDLTEPEREAERAWALTERGTAASVSVLDFGPGAPPVSFSPLELTRVNVGSHTTTTLASIPMDDYRYGPAASANPVVGTVSPDGHTIALVETTPTSDLPDSLRRAEQYMSGFRLTFVSLDRPGALRWVTVDSLGFHTNNGRGNDIGVDVTNCGPRRAVWTADGRSVIVHVLRDTAANDRWFRVAMTGDMRLNPVAEPPTLVADTIRPPLMLRVEKSPGLYDRYDLVLHGRDTVLTLNANGSRIDAGRKIAFTYRGMEGDSLTALLQLPIGYVPGRRYPMITIVYNSQIRHPDDTVPNMDDALWAGHGYLVLYPSMPVAAGGVGPADVFVDLPKGVFPAIDRVIELGYADSARIGVRGHSYGGYTTFGLVAISNRFKAAIAEAGPVDFTSFYGTFYAGWRYRDSLIVPPSGLTGQLQAGGPPWANVGRYFKNSVLNYVDRIHTPIMIVQGDFDVVPIEQGEQIFSSLIELGRRAQFVRYWGEGHWLVSPANIRDKWQREIAWFDMFLKTSTDSSSHPN